MQTLGVLWSLEGDSSASPGICAFRDSTGSCSLSTERDSAHTSGLLPARHHPSSASFLLLTECSKPSLWGWPSLLSSTALKALCFQQPSLPSPRSEMRISLAQCTLHFCVDCIPALFLVFKVYFYLRERLGESEDLPSAEPGLAQALWRGTGALSSAVTAGPKPAPPSLLPHHNTLPNSTQVNSSTQSISHRNVCPLMRIPSKINTEKKQI